jgi:hypothetical protein
LSVLVLWKRRRDCASCFMRQACGCKMCMAIISTPSLSSFQARASRWRYFYLRQGSTFACKHNRLRCFLSSSPTKNSFLLHFIPELIMHYLMQKRVFILAVPPNGPRLKYFIPNKCALFQIAIKNFSSSNLDARRSLKFVHLNHQEFSYVYEN